jgi:hypothetical protein
MVVIESIVSLALVQVRLASGGMSGMGDGLPDILEGTRRGRMSGDRIYRRDGNG